MAEVAEEKNIPEMAEDNGIEESLGEAEELENSESPEALEDSGHNGRVKKPVFIHLRSSQYSEKLEEKGEAFARTFDLEDSLDIDTEGFYYTVNGVRYLLYNESQELGLGNVRTLIRIRDKEVEIKRFSKEEPQDMDIRLEQGVRCITRYVLPVQSLTLDLELYTHKLGIDLTPEGTGTIEAEYTIKFDRFGNHRNKLKITVEPDEDRETGRS